MHPAVLSQLLCSLSGAPDLGPYLFDPTDFPAPDWSAPLVDSARTDRPTGFQAVVRDTLGRIIGHDTAEIFLEAGSLHTRKTQWKYGADTARSIHEYWKNDGIIDSLIWRTCKGDSCTTGIRQWARNTPQGTLYIIGYDQNPDLTFDRYDSLLLRRNADGRFAYGHVWHATNGGYNIDSVEWRGGTPSRWIRDWRNAGVLLHERHHPTWDGSRLLRDSVVRRTTSESGTISDTTIVNGCTWDGPRILSCFTLPDSSLYAMAEWSSQGRIVRRVTEKGRMSAWSWDSRGRVTGVRLWGSETDFDSLVYSDGDLPVQSRIYNCDDASWGMDSCTLVKTRAFTYSAMAPAGVRRASSRRPDVQRRPGGRLLFERLPHEAVRVTLLRPNGQILSSATANLGSCEHRIPEGRGLVLWGVFDADGRLLFNGRVPNL